MNAVVLFMCLIVWYQFGYSLSIFPISLFCAFELFTRFCGFVFSYLSSGLLRILLYSSLWQHSLVRFVLSIPFIGPGLEMSFRSI